MILIEDQFAGVEITDGDADQIEVVGAPIHYIETRIVLKGSTGEPGFPKILFGLDSHRLRFSGSSNCAATGGAVATRAGKVLRIR